MAANNDAAARKRLSTYGKAAKRKPFSSVSTGFTPFAGDIWDPIDDAATNATIPPPAAPAAKAQASRAPESTGKGKQLARQYGRRGTSKPPDQTQSQPLPQNPAAGYESEGDNQKAKKRKITRTMSEKREMSAGLYSTPDSSPTGMRSPDTQSSGTDPVAQPAKPPNLPPRVKSPPVSQSTPMRGVVTADRPRVLPPFSAKTSRALDNLSVRDKPADKKQQIPLRLGRGEPSHSGAEAKERRPSPESRPRPKAAVPTAPSASRRKRLIDVLAEQAEDNSSSEGEESKEDDELAILSRRVPTSRRSTPPPAIQPQPQSAVRVRATPMGQKAGPKFTYGQQRTILAEPNGSFDQFGLGSVGDVPSKASLFDYSALASKSTADAFSFMDEDDETGNSGAVRTIHELRQAGANSRFGDEMHDIIDRISAPTPKPSSLRRGALLELAQRVQEKEFRRQFRNHGEGDLFKQVGQEMDTIGGYAIVSALVTLFASSTSAHLVPQLRAQGIMALLSRFLDETSDIIVIARDRKNNVSKNGQNTLSAIKSAILKLPVWEPTQPKTLPPRTLALKCLDLILRHSTDPATEDDIFTPAVTDLLFTILSASNAEPNYWDFPREQESTDLYYTISLLESHSVTAMESHLALHWTTQYAPVLADTLEKALRRPADKFDQLESLTLRLTMNATNNNPDAVGIFVEKGLLQDLAGTASDTFDVLLKSLAAGTLLSQTLESLILMLGVMINFCEHYPPAAQSLADMDDGSPLDQLIRLFLDHGAKTSDVSNQIAMCTIAMRDGG